MAILQQYHFHRQKLVLDRASLKFYADWLSQQGYQVHYIETSAEENDCRVLVQLLAKQTVTQVHIAAVADNWLQRRLEGACGKYQIALKIYDSPNWLNTVAGTAAYFEKKRSYFQTDFYKWQRIERRLLLEKDEQPVGGRWTFDTDNRQRFPRKEQAAELPQKENNRYVDEAEQYISIYFPGSYGAIGSPHLFAVTFEDARK